MPVLYDERKPAQLFGLEARRHGHIGMIPIAEHAESLEVGALAIDLFVRVLSARRAKRLGVDFLSDASVRFFHLHLDGQPVAIPTGYIGRVVAVQGTRL